MRRYLIAYSLWLAGVLTAAGIAYLYYRRVATIGAEELARELADRDGAPAPAAAPAPRSPEG